MARTFRLFLSSTFSDFQEEREALQKQVFPKLELYCAQRGARFQAIDLRWGITEEAQQQHDTMRICLEEVRRSQELSPRPNFAVLLGDRYGWEPVPARIPLAHWQRLLKAAVPADRNIIRDAYQPEPDRNAIPPVMWLVKRVGDWASGQVREETTRESLRRSANRAGFTGDERLPYFASATHQEIALGALAGEDAHEHVHVYIRHIEGLPLDKSASAFIDWDAMLDQCVPGARERLRALDGQLRDRLGDMVHDVRAHWNDGIVNASHVADFCEVFYQHQVSLIERELLAQQQTGEFDERECAHAAFALERSRIFAGRKLLLRQLASYLNPRGKQPPRSPLVLIGAGGSGKSALLAKAVEVERVAAKTSQAVVVARFIGGVPGTESLMSLLGTLIADLAQIYDQPQPPSPENTKELARAFEQALGYATAERPLQLFLDALDQLDSTDNAWMLEWMPRELPPHVRVVASLRPSSVELAARRRFQNGIVEIPLMTPSQGTAMLNAWLVDKRAAWFNAGIAPSLGRRLTLLQRQAVLQAFATNGSPLWLKLAYEVASSWPSWHQPELLLTTVEGLIENLINQHLLEEENHPKVFTQRAVAYLAAARFGLAEDELARALGTDPMVRQEFEANEKTQRKWDDPHLLPPVLWSRLYFDLQPYLGIVNIDGALLIRWFHREFKEVICKHYLETSETKDAVHGNLAATFLDIERTLRPSETNDDALFRSTDAGGKPISAALRRVMEQPWQLAQAGKKKELEVLLTDFGFFMGKCAANRAEGLLTDYLTSGISRASASGAYAWLEVIQSQAHLLRRGLPQWPAHKILLQVATEHADDSAITLAAQQWLQRGHCDWVWMRRKDRPQVYASNPCLMVLEGHTGSVRGAQLLPDGRILSWSSDDTLRLWDGRSGAVLAVLQGHKGSVHGAQLLLDGRILSWSDDGTLCLWDGQSGAALAVLRGHTEQVDGVQFLSDGRILSWSYDGTLRLWSGQIGAALAVLDGHTKWVRGAQLLSNGSILSWSGDGSLRLWNGQSGAVLAVLQGHTDALDGAQSLADGRILSWSHDGTLRLWDGQSGAALAVLHGHTEWVKGAQSLSDGRILSWSRDCTLRLWDGQSGAALTVLHGHTEWVDGAQLLSDSRILSWSYDGTLRLWDGQNGAALAVMHGHTKWVRGAKLLPDGRILSWSDDGTLRLWDGQSGAALAVLHGHTGTFLEGGVNGAQFLPDGSILSWSNDCTLRRWDGQTGRFQVEQKGHMEWVQLLPDGRILSWSDDCTFRLWDGQSGAVLSLQQGQMNGAYGAQLLPDGRILLRSRHGTLGLWDRKASPMLTEMPGHTDWVEGAKLLPDDRILSWSYDGTLRLWDAQSGASLAVLRGHTAKVLGAQFLPDRRILSWSQDATLRLWDGESGAVLAVLKGHTEWVHGAQLLPDGHILTWSGDGTLRLWNGQTFAALAVLQGHTKRVHNALLLPDSRILSWSWDGTLRLWDAQTGAALVVLKGHTANVYGTRLLSDGRIMSWSTDGTLRLWDGQNGESLAVLQGHTGTLKGAQLLPDGRILSWSSDGTMRLWNGQSGVCLGTMPANSVETTAFPGPWREHAHRTGVRNRGTWWAQAIDQRISIVDSATGQKTCWHANADARLVETTSGPLCAHVGNELVFFETLRGAQPFSLDQ